MANQPKTKIIEESPEVVAKYERLKTLGREYFAAAHIVKGESIGDNGVALVRRFVSRAITETKPEVWASYFDHIIIAPELGKRIATAAQAKDKNIDVALIEFLLWLHDIGRLVTPSAYFRNDLIDYRLLKEFGIPESIISQLPSLENLLETAREMTLSPDQITFKEPLNESQKIIAQKYFDSQSAVQKIINLADNLGKRSAKGLFDLKDFLEYLKTQEDRYEPLSQWPTVNWAIERRQQGAVLQAFVIKATHAWLKELHISVDQILDEMRDYGPKYIILSRHGDLNNPRSIVYNRDSVMKPEDIMHLSEIGITKMQNIGGFIKERKFAVQRIIISPETRARESANELNRTLHLNKENITENAAIDEVRAAGPYQEGMLLAKWKQMKGDAFDPSRWGKYNHETPAEIINRTSRLFWTEAKSLITGQATIFISHGDPIGFLVNHEVSGKRLYVDVPRDQSIYPNKGEAFIMIIGPDQKLFSYYLLADESAQPDSSF